MDNVVNVHHSLRTRLAAAAVGAFLLTGLGLSLLGIVGQSHGSDGLAGRKFGTPGMALEDKTGTRWR
jgi:hypothetical protein